MITNIKLREFKNKVKLQRFLFENGVTWYGGGKELKDLAPDTQCFYVDQQGRLTVSSYFSSYWNECPFEEMTFNGNSLLSSNDYRDPHKDSCPLHGISDWTQFNNDEFEIIELTDDGIYSNLLLARNINHKQYALLSSNESDSMVMIDYCPFCGCELI